VDVRMDKKVVYDEIVKNNIKKDDIISGSISNQIKSVIGFEIGIILLEQEKNIVKISIRTRDSNKYDVSKLAVALGGGGHQAAAGASLTGGIKEAIETIVQNIKIVYNM
jgi:phosphoesterase RecJ-like protein